MFIFRWWFLRHSFVERLLKFFPPLPVIILALFWIIQAAAALGFLIYEYGGSRLGLIMHFIIMILLLLLCILPFTFKFVSTISFSFRRLILASILSVINCVMLFFYAITMIGYHKWNGPLTFELLRTYAGQIDVLLSIYGFSVSTVVFLMLIIFLLMFGIYFVFSRILLTALVPLNNGIAFHRGKHNGLWKNLSYMLVGLIPLVYAVTYPYWFIREPFHIALMSGNGFLRQAPPELFAKEHPAGETSKRMSIQQINSIKPRPLILIMVDSLRSDQMGVYGAPEDNTPFLSGLYRRRQLHRIDTAYSICTASFCGIIGTLSSRYWHQLNHPPINLADVLNQYGYRTGFLLSGDNLHFFGLRSIYGPNIDVYRDGSIEQKKYINDDRMVLHWLYEFNWASPNRTFLYIHLMSVHALGLRDPHFRQWLPDKDFNLLKLSTKPAAYRNNYHNGILQADNTIKQIFDVLEKRGVLERSVVVITADHGEYLGESDVFGHGHKPHEPMVRIPLLIYDRRESNYPKRLIASQVDIAATMLYAIRAGIPNNWSGIPLQVPASRNFVYIDSYDFSGVTAVVAGHRFKYLQNRKKGDELLFNLDNEKAESINLAAKPEMKPVMTAMRNLNALKKRN